VNAKTEYGTTPLHWALEKGNKNVADLLREHGGIDLSGAAPSDRWW
jgi:ankyrin repeat protein